MATKGDTGLGRLPIRISKLLGRAFKSEDNNQLGVIRDLVTGPDGQIGYVLVAYGGTLGMGEKIAPVPWHAVRIHHSGGDYFISVNISKENFERAPYLSDKEWSNYAATDWEGNIQNYYESALKPGEFTG